MLRWTPGSTTSSASELTSRCCEVLRDLSPSDRQRIVIASGAGTFLLYYQNLRKGLENRLRQLRTDYLDVFLFLGVTKRSTSPKKLAKNFSV